MGPDRASGSPLKLGPSLSSMEASLSAAFLHAPLLTTDTPSSTEKGVLSAPMRFPNSTMLGTLMPTSLSSSTEAKTSSGVPPRTNSPDFMTKTRSASSSMSSTSCSIKMIVIPKDLLRSRMIEKTRALPSGSNMDVGSSSTMILGSMA